MNISSLAGVFGLPFGGHYSASKFALEGMSEALRYETRRFGIHVALVEPGDFHTAISARRRVAAAAATNDAYRERFAEVSRQQEHEEQTGATPEPIARLVERILNNPKPKLRYPVGKPSQTMVVPLPALAHPTSLRLAGLSSDGRMSNPFEPLTQLPIRQPAAREDILERSTKSPTLLDDAPLRSP